MTVLIALLVLALHAALLVLATPAVTGVLRWAGTGLAGTPAGRIRQEWAEIARLWRKQPLLTEPSAPLLRAAPAISAATTAVAALLVPSFSLGTVLAPWADLLSVIGLLTLARLPPLLASLDSGAAPLTITAARHTRVGVMAAAASLPVILALALGTAPGIAPGVGPGIGGETHGLMLAQIGAARFDDMVMPGAVRGLAAIVLAAIATADLSCPPLDEAFSGPDLAMIRLTEALRLMVWFNLLLTLFAPVGLAGPDAGMADWPLAILIWCGRLAVLTLLVAVPYAVVGRPTERSLSAILIVAAGLGLLAALLALTHTGAV